MDLLVSVAAAAIALGVLITLHEAGHFLAARMSGMRVSRFSIGFGSPILKTKKGETEYQVAAIPLGGFVQIDGMNPHDGTDPDSPRSFMKKPFHLRFVTILAGPLANYAIGYVLFFLFFAFFYVESLAPVRVVKVVEGSPAAKAGLLAGDLITGTSSSAFERSTDLIQAVQAAGAANEAGVVLAVKRGDEALRLRLVPEAIAEGGYQIGIGYEGTGTRSVPKGVSLGAQAAVDEVAKVSASLVALLSAPFHRGKRSGGEMTGPIGIVGAIAQRLRTSAGEALGLVAQISVGLGFMNLLPIPALDGSRLLFLLVGLVRKREISPKVEVVVHTVGLALLIVLLVLLSVRDVGTMLKTP